MKLYKQSIVVAVMVFTALSAFAATNAPPAPPEGVDKLLSIQWVQMLIIVVVPMIIAGLKQVWPKIPKVALPFIAPILGLALDYALKLAGKDFGNPELSAVLGAAGVWLREAVDQIKKATAKPSPTP